MLFAGAFDYCVLLNVCGWSFCSSLFLMSFVVVRCVLLVACCLLLFFVNCGCYLLNVGVVVRCWRCC